MNDTLRRESLLQKVFGKKTKITKSTVGLILQAFDDIRDRIVLPSCPDCGGHLFFIDKSMGGGIKCCGHSSIDINGDEYYDVDNGCGGHFYITSIDKPIELRRFV